MSSRKLRKGDCRRWAFGVCEYAEFSRKLIVDGQPVKMESKPLDVLLQLLEHPTEVVEKDDLLNAVWPEVATTEQSLTTAIAKLRRAFGGPRDSVILNEAGIGYRMGVTVHCFLEEQHAPFPLNLQVGAAIPRRANWHAIQRLNDDERSPVWLAEHPKTGERRVYKFAVDGVRLRALQREVAISRLLQKSLGPNATFAVKILEWGFEETPFFTESEFCGLNLLEWSRTPSFLQMTLEQRVEFAARLAEGVASAHILGILHNDLKPGNILVSTSHNSAAREVATSLPPWTVRIADFGVASFRDLSRLRELDITDHGSFDGQPGEAHSTPVGTVMYRAPEVSSGASPTTLADVYALGVLLYQIVCGDFVQPPSPGWESRIADPILQKDIADAANVNPDLRLSSASNLADRLHTLPQRRQEAHRQHRADEKARRDQAALEAARLRRPWVVGGTVALTLGLCLSLWFYHRAVHDRDLVNARNATLAAMVSFVTQDVLGQANPYRPAGRAYTPQQTLVDAITEAAPQIDRRFPNDPEIAARLHETIADSLRNRRRFVDADREYAVAAQRYRQAEGTLSENAIVAELEREMTAMAGLVPGAVQATKAGFDRQETLIAKLPHPSAVLEAWRTLVSTALIAVGSKPETTIPLLTQAIKGAEATPGFDRALLIRLKNQICGIYVRLQDGPALDHASREVLDLEIKQYGDGSPHLATAQMYIEEALYLEGKYAEVIAQADSNFTSFTRLLGPEHELTLATLATRATAEGQLERYDDAARDDLKLAAAEQSNPSGARMRAGSLGDAAMFECHAGHFPSGMEHAREVLKETGSGPNVQPVFSNGALYTLADCVIAEREQIPSAKNVHAADEAESLLRRVDAKLVAEQGEDANFQSTVDVALARVALLRGQPQAARPYLDRAEPAILRKDTAHYLKKAFSAARQTSLRP